MPEQSLKQKLKESIAKLRLRLTRNTSKPSLKKTATGKKSISIKLPKINFGFKKKKPEPEIPLPSKSLPKGVKIVDKYPLYEPFAQVVVIQDPKTGEYKYILDELQLDPLERGIYNRILEILLAEIESPKEEIADPRKM